MLRNNTLTNEQKLEEVYQILKRQEARNIRERWFRLIKWAIILGVAFYTVTNREVIIEKVTKNVGPVVIDNMTKMMEKAKAGLLEDMRIKAQQLGE